MEDKDLDKYQELYKKTKQLTEDINNANIELMKVKSILEKKKLSAKEVFKGINWDVMPEDNILFDSTIGSIINCIHRNNDEEKEQEFIEEID